MYYREDVLKRRCANYDMRLDVSVERLAEVLGTGANAPVDTWRCTLVLVDNERGPDDWPRITAMSTNKGAAKKKALDELWENWEELSKGNKGKSAAEMNDARRATKETANMRRQNHKEYKCHVARISESTMIQMCQDLVSACRAKDVAEIKRLCDELTARGASVNQTMIDEALASGGD
jgi:hypothetical protein